MSDNRIENIFNQAFEDDAVPYQPADWEQMNHLLDEAGPDKQPNDRKGGFAKWLLGIGALLLLGVAAWWFTRQGGSATTITKNNTVPQSVSQQAPLAPATTVASDTAGSLISAGSPQPSGNNSLAGNSPELNNDAADAIDNSAWQLWQDEAGNIQMSPAGKRSGNKPLENTNWKLYRKNGHYFVELFQPATDAVNIASRNFDMDRTGHVRRHRLMRVRKDVYVWMQPVQSSRPVQSDWAVSSSNKRPAVKNVTTDTDEPLEDPNQKMEVVETDGEAAAPATSSTIGDIENNQIVAGKVDTLMIKPVIVMDSEVKPNQHHPSPTAAGKKKGKKSFGEKILGVPQWISAGISVTPIASRYKSITPIYSNTMTGFSADSGLSASVAHPGFYLALGSEWYPKNTDKWSVNSYIMLQYAPAKHLSKSTRYDYGTSYVRYDTTAFISSLTALRLGAEWTRHPANKKWQWGLGTNIQLLAVGRGETGIFENTVSGGTSSFGKKNWGMFNGLNRFNVGISASAGYKLSSRWMVELRANYDVLDMTRNAYYRQQQKHNLTYFATGLRYMFKKD
jgi:hypothetical protein